MKKLFVAVAFLILTIFAKAQEVSIIANVVDTDSQSWNNGTWQLDFVPNPSQPSLPIYYYNNSGTLQQITTVYSALIHQTGSMDAGGNVIGALALNNNLITPIGSQWKITLCPNASSKCGSLTFAVTTTSTWTIPPSSITAAIPAPRFNAIAGQYGYSDTEAILTVPVGATYWNTLSLCQRYFNGSSWSCAGSAQGLVNPAAQFSFYGQPNAGTQSIANPLPNISAKANGTLVVGVTNTSSFGPNGSVWADGNSTGSNMTRVGDSALQKQTSGFANTAIGANALQNLTTGTWNVAVGHVAMQYATTIAPNPALSNTAVGNNALQFDLDGQVNSAFGANSLINNTRGVSNDCSGKDSCWSISTGYQNVGHGVNALTCSNGFGNVALGYRSMFGLDSANTTGIVNTSIGNSGGTGYVLGDILTIVQAGASGGTVTVEQVDGSGVVQAVSAVSTPGNGYAIANNLATTGGTGTGATIDVTELSPIGGCYPTLDQGQQNVAIGTNAMELNDGTGSGTGSQNVAIGAFSLHSNTQGAGNVGVGINSLVNTTIGTENVGVGNNACGNVTTGNDNICLGINSGRLVTTQDNTINIGQSTNALLNGVAVGLDALQNNAQQDNTAVGSFSLQSNTTGASNTAFGINALQGNTTGFSNTAEGATSCNLITTGDQDICFGASSSIGAAINDAIAIGHSASATGGFSQAIGDAASVTGTNSVALGTSASCTGANNCIAIGQGVTNSTGNTIQFGSSSITDTYLGGGTSTVHTGPIIGLSNVTGLGISFAAGSMMAGGTGKVVYGTDTTNGYAEVNENNTGPSRICSVANGLCAAAPVSCIPETTSFSATAGTCYYLNSSSSITATLPSISAGAVVFFQNIGSASSSIAFGSNVSCTISHTITSVTSCAVASGFSARVSTDGTTWFVYVF